MLAKRYHGVGLCIYCGSTTYAPDSNRFLGLEHVIPEALSGTLELPEASCRACERAINPWETRLLKGSLMGSRILLGLETKRPKDRPKRLPLFDTRATPNRKVMVDVGDFPVTIMLTAFDGPSALTGVPIQHATEKVWLHFLSPVDQRLLARKYGLFDFATSSFDARAFTVTIAKIAHAFLAGELGMRSFVPLLPHFIMGDHFAWHRHYIGGLLTQEPAAPELHQISIEEQTVENWPFYVVRLRLFSNIEAPTYRIVAGQRLTSAKPAEVLLAEAGVARSSHKTVSAYPTTHPIPTGLWDRISPSANEAPELKLKRFRRVDLRRQK